MRIKILGPVGSGKSTIARGLAEALNYKFIPEIAENDVKFFRLLNKRNRTQSPESKMEFQCYTFEQAYARQYGQEDCVIDVPVEQHFIMASASLKTALEFEEYDGYFRHYMHKESLKSDVFIIIDLPFEETLNRIKKRNRQEEKMSLEESQFYKDVYDKILIQKLYPEGAIIVDGTKSPVEIVVDILGLLPKEY